MKLLAPDDPTLFLVGHAPEVARPLRAALKPHRVKMVGHRSAEAFFEACEPTRPGCLVWDLSVHGPGAGELFELLAQHRIRLPVIFVSEKTDAASVVEAMKAGALNFLEKPLQQDALWEPIREAFARDGENRAQARRLAGVRRRISRLSPGERAVLERLLRGDSNRDMADALGLSVRTIEVRRAKLMKKMKARSLAELVRMALTAENGF